MAIYNMYGHMYYVMLLLLQRFLSSVLVLHSDGGHKSLHLIHDTHHQHLWHPLLSHDAASRISVMHYPQIIWWHQLWQHGRTW